MFGEKRLSINHWRYRILHWAFNEKNVEKPEDTKLPMFLYTHYCPLFHLTNFIALFAWLILFCRVVIVIGKAVWVAVSSINLSFINFDKTETVEKEDPEEYRRKRQRKDFVRQAKFLEAWIDPDSFIRVWSTEYSLLTTEEMLTLIEKVRLAHERSEAKKKVVRERIVFWSNFSRVFINWALLSFYAVVLVLAAWFAYSLFWPVVNFFGNCVTWFLSLDPMSAVPVIVFLTKTFFATAVFLSLFWVIRKYSIFQRFGRGVAAGIKPVLIPVNIFRDLFGAFFEWCEKGFDAVVEFVSVFYEEHCPPIVIVDKEDEEVDEVCS